MDLRKDERALRLAAGGNRFALTSLVRVRAHELAYGAMPQVITGSNNYVNTAIVEASLRRDVAPASAVVDEPVVVREIVCAGCGNLALIRRKVGTELRGRPPTRCAPCGLSANWEQLVTAK